MIILDNQKFLETDERNRLISEIVRMRQENGGKTKAEGLRKLADSQILAAYTEEVNKKERIDQKQKENKVKAKNDSLEWTKYLEQIKKNLEKAKEKYGDGRFSQISIDEKVKPKTLNEEQRKLYQEMVDGTFKITDINSKETQNLTDAEKWGIINRENEEMHNRAQEMLDLDKEVGGRKR